MTTQAYSQNQSTEISAISVDVDDISETPQNWTIYRKPDQSGQEWNDLCDSIEENGINTPLELSSDYYVISGHRRLAAARHIGLEQVPAFTREDINIGQMDDAERTLLLTERNRGTRVKSDSEMFIEGAARMDTEEAIRIVRHRKQEHFNKAKSSGEEVFSVGSIRRTDPSGARKELLEAVIDIITKYRGTFGGITMSGRAIHYQLLNRKVRTSSGSAGFIYGTVRFNKKGKPKDSGAKLLSKLLTDARSAGLIPYDWIDDSTRPTCTWPAWSPQKYLQRELRGLFMNYFSDVHRDQPAHVELLLEKNTLFELFKEKIARPLRLPITAMHGYGSQPPARDIADRFKASGKDKLIVVYAADLDPEGVNMPRSFKKYLLHDHGVDAIVVRAGVLPAHIEKYNLPPDADVKLSSTRAKGFIKEYGEKCWELDSFPPLDLIEEVSNVCRGCLVMPIFERAMKAEEETDAGLARLNQAVKHFTLSKGLQLLTEEAA